MIRVPESLSRYVDFEEGKIVAVELPRELQADFDEFKKQYEHTKAPGDLTDY